MAIATVETVAMRTPAMISGSASGSSTFHNNCRFVIPIPVPESRADPGTFANPELALR